MEWLSRRKLKTYCRWHFCHDICSFVIKVDISLKNYLINVLDKQLEKHPEMKCVKERVGSLKKYKLKEE